MISQSAQSEVKPVPPIGSEEETTESLQVEAADTLPDNESDSVQAELELLSLKESLRISWDEAQRGELIPLAELWEGIDAE